jgi:hypothetical protein
MWRRCTTLPYYETSGRCDRHRTLAALPRWRPVDGQTPRRAAPLPSQALPRGLVLGIEDEDLAEEPLSLGLLPPSVLDLGQLHQMEEVVG